MATKGLKSRKRSEDSNPFRASSRLIGLYHAVARTFPGYGHEDVAEVILNAERGQHAGICLGQQLRRGHIDVVDLSEASDARARVENTQALTGPRSIPAG